MNEMYRFFIEECIVWRWAKITCLVYGFFFVYQQYTYIQAEKKWNVAIEQYPVKKTTSINHMQQFSHILSNNSLFLSSFATMKRENGEYDEAICLYYKSLNYRVSYYTYIDLGKCYSLSGNTSMALECWDIASQMIPSRFLPIYLSAHLYIETGNIEKAQELKAILQCKKRKVDTPVIDRMLLELNGGEIRKSD